MVSEQIVSKSRLRPVTPHSILREALISLEEKLKSEGVSMESLDLIQRCRELSGPLDEYLMANTSPPSDALNALEVETNKLDWESAFKTSQTGLQLEREMLSGAVEGQFLKMLTSISNARRVLEIGSFTGYASLAIAEALPSNGSLIACEYDRFTAEFARKQLSKSEHGKKVDIRIGDAMATLKELSKVGETFDMVFIDADKQNYYAYYAYLLDSGLVKKDGIICVDNTLFMGQAYNAGKITANGQAIMEFNKAVSADERVQQVLLPLRDGVSVIRRVN